MGRSLLLLVVVFGTACSGKAESITKVDGKKTFDKLSADDRKQLCTDFIAFGKKNRNPKSEQEMTCKMNAVLGLTEGDDKTKSCKELYDTCMAKPIEKQDEPDEMDCKFLEEISCDVTVAEFVGCLQEQIAVSKAVIAELSCDKPPKGDSATYMTEFLEKMNASPKCKSFKDRCDKPK